MADGKYTPRVNENEKAVLSFLVEQNDYDGFYFFSFSRIMDATGLDRKSVRKACRSLKRKGLAKFGSGLWTEDGEPAGSGYAAARAAIAKATGGA